MHRRPCDGCRLQADGKDADAAVARALLDAAGDASVNLRARPAERPMRLLCRACRFAVRAGATRFLSRGSANAVVRLRAPSSSGTFLI